MRKDKNIYITNDLIRKLLDNSSNASKLVEEALIFYVYAIENNILDAKEVNRIFAQGLIKLGGNK